MASEINQVLPLALGQLVNQNHQLGLDINPSALAQSGSSRDVAYLTQVAATQLVSKVNDTDKKRSVQVPKRSEPDFSSQEDKKEDEESESSLEHTAKKKHPGDLDLVA